MTENQKISLGLKIFFFTMFSACPLSLGALKHVSYSSPIVKIEDVQKDYCRIDENNETKCWYQISYHYEGKQHHIVYRFSVNDPEEFFFNNEWVIDAKDGNDVERRDEYDTLFYVFLGIYILLFLLLFCFGWLRKFFFKVFRIGH